MTRGDWECKRTERYEFTEGLSNNQHYRSLIVRVPSADGISTGKHTQKLHKLLSVYSEYISLNVIQ